MKNYWLPFLWICFLLPFIACEKEYSCENCIEETEPLPPVPAGDSVLYFQITIDNKNYRAIAYETNHIVASSIDWYGSDMDSGVVITSVILSPSTLPGVQGPNSLVLYRGVIKYYN